MGFCWEVVWADSTGERWVGKLTEFFDPVALKDLVGGDHRPGTQSYLNPGVWGTVRFPELP